MISHVLASWGSTLVICVPLAPSFPLPVHPQSSQSHAFLTNKSAEQIPSDSLLPFSARPCRSTRSVYRPHQYCPNTRTCAHTHTNTHTHRDTQTHVQTQAHTCQTRTHTHRHTCTHRHNAQTHTQRHAHTETCTRTETAAHARAHTHTHRDAPTQRHTDTHAHRHTCTVLSLSCLSCGGQESSPASVSVPLKQAEWVLPSLLLDWTEPFQPEGQWPTQCGDLPVSGQRPRAGWRSARAEEARGALSCALKAPQPPWRCPLPCQGAELPLWTGPLVPPPAS